jgi:glycosyltransferase involved in cell wall biosynthesis
MKDSSNYKLTILIPCFNEEATIGKVIDDFKRELPGCEIIVYDNNSTDRSAELAREHGASVTFEPRQGKGFVVESMFKSLDSDIFVMVDGDDTYPAEKVHELIEPIVNSKADMVVGSRLSDFTDGSFRNLHMLGNKLVRFCINKIMGSDLKDIMSGYRAFNSTIAKTIPVVSSGFEIETELSIQTLYYKRKIIEVEVPYRDRPEGSESKLNTFKDGFRVLWKIFSLFRALKPLTFFGSAGILFFVLGIAVGSLPVYDYFTNEGHYVTHVPSAILSASLILMSTAFVFLGVLLHAINWRFKELHSVLTRN